MLKHFWDRLVGHLRDVNPPLPFVRMMSRTVALTFIAVGLLLATIDVIARSGAAMTLSSLAVIGIGCAIWWLARFGGENSFDRAIADSLAWRRVPVPRTPDIIEWWELRRIPYNLIVGAAGVMSGIFAFICAGISESRGGEPVGMPDGIFILAAPILFGVAANVFYTCGWLVELAIRRLFNADMRGFAPLAFTGGLAFSLGLTALPALIALTYMLALVTGLTLPPSTHPPL